MMISILLWYQKRLKRFTIRHILNQVHNQPNILYSNKKNRNNFKTINNNRINFLYSLVLLHLSSKSILFITHSLDRERAWTFILSSVSRFSDISTAFFCSEFRATRHLSYSNGSLWSKYVPSWFTNLGELVQYKNV